LWAGIAPSSQRDSGFGHRDVAMVAKGYGRFKPDTEERGSWEPIAAGPDGEKWDI